MNMRKSINGLSVIVEAGFALDPLSDSLFVFCNRSAVYFSLIETAKENGLVPFDYLTRVFNAAPNDASLDTLLLWGT
jgi:hypothetical protein